MSLSSIKLNCCGSGSWGRHPGWLAHAWPTLSTGELSQKVPTEIAKADAARLYLSATWTRARFSWNICKLCLQGPCGTSDDITSYTWVSWLSATAGTMDDALPGEKAFSDIGMNATCLPTFSWDNFHQRCNEPQVYLN